jgi:hypothetical protein
MGIRDRIEERSNSFRALFVDDEQSIGLERALVLLVARVRKDELGERRPRDVYVAARKRRRRLGMMALTAGPLAGVANQFADLYCEAAIVCDLAALHGVALGDDEAAAHLLVLWGLVGDHDEAKGVIAGEPPLVGILAGKAMTLTETQRSDLWTRRGAVQALWEVRGAIDDIGKGSVRAVVFTGHRTKQLIKRTEAQLGVR